MQRAAARKRKQLSPNMRAVRERRRMREAAAARPKRPVNPSPRLTEPTPGVRTQQPHLGFAREQFEQIQSRVGARFTLEAYPGMGDELIGPKSHSGSQAFVGSECAGQRIWLHAPPGKVSEALAWYQEQKAKSPHNTSACVVVQQWRKAPYKAQLAGMRLIHQVPAGQALLSTASADGAPTAVPSPHTL